MKFFKSMFSLKNISMVAFFFAIGWIIVYPQDWVWGIAMLVWEKVVLAMLSKEIAHHRYFCHRSFETGKFRRYFLMGCTIFGPSDPITVTMIHHHHHVHSDTEQDPHFPTKKMSDRFTSAFFTSRIHNYWGKLLATLPLPKYLIRDSKLLLLHKYSDLLFVVVCTTLLLFSWKTVVFILLAGRGLFSINSILFGLILTHVKLPGGYQGFDTKDNSYNTPWLGYFHPGEAYHNNHHFKPNAWNFAMKPGEFDVVGWIIGRVFLQR